MIYHNISKLAALETAKLERFKLIKQFYWGMPYDPRILRNIPMPESNHHYRAILTRDHEDTGYRVIIGRTCLEEMKR